MFVINAYTLPVLVIISLLSGCSTLLSTSNEGSTSARIMKHGNASITSGLFVPSSAAGASEASIIKTNEAFSVRLLSAYICDFREAGSASDWMSKNTAATTKCAGGDGNQNARVRGEIAIVASVGERKGGNGLSYDPAAVKNGRVIYYNQDVRETGQLINAMNLPVYGPKTYDGLPFYMDWTVLELDNEANDAAQGLLKQLADLGSVAYAPATPILNVLNSLGDSLIKGNSDDIEMRFQLETDHAMQCKSASCAKTSMARLPLREGYYAFIRGENRNADIDLSKVSVCEDTGLLCEAGKPWRASTWLLVRISRENKEAAAAQDNAQKFAELVDALSASKTSVDPAAFKELLNAAQPSLRKYLGLKSKGNK